MVFLPLFALAHLPYLRCVIDLVLILVVIACMHAFFDYVYSSCFFSYFFFFVCLIEANDLVLLLLLLLLFVFRLASFSVLREPARYSRRRLKPYLQRT